jgi:hypothetical protein
MKYLKTYEKINDSNDIRKYGNQASHAYFLETINVWRGENVLELEEKYYTILKIKKI